LTDDTEERFREVDDVDFIELADRFTDELEVRAGATAEVDPGTLAFFTEFAIDIFATLEESFAKIVVVSGLSGVEVLHALRVVFSANGPED
jgi:hypothetical protein